MGSAGSVDFHDIATSEPLSLCHLEPLEPLEPLAESEDVPLVVVAPQAPAKFRERAYARAFSPDLHSPSVSPQLSPNLGALEPEDLPPPLQWITNVVRSLSSGIPREIQSSSLTPKTKFRKRAYARALSPDLSDDSDSPHLSPNLGALEPEDLPPPLHWFTSVVRSLSSGLSCDLETPSLSLMSNFRERVYARAFSPDLSNDSDDSSSTSSSANADALEPIGLPPPLDRI